MSVCSWPCPQYMPDTSLSHSRHSVNVHRMKGLPREEWSCREGSGSVQTFQWVAHFVSTLWSQCSLAAPARGLMKKSF